MKLSLATMITTGGVLGLFALALAQTPSPTHNAAAARAHEVIASAPCPIPKVVKEKITEDQARDLAQQYADKNWSGFKVERPSGYGGGYNTMCIKDDAAGKGFLTSYSVEYSIDLKNSAGEGRNLCVDQFGYVSEFCGPIGMAGARGPTGPAGERGPAGAAGAQAAMRNWSWFKNVMFDTDKADIQPKETSKVSETAAYLKENSSVSVGLNGYADPRGADQYNQALSERRVNAVREALVNAGVPGEKIQVIAFGEQRPHCHQATAECLQRNRVVEVLIGTEATASR